MIIEIDNVELYFNNKSVLNGVYLKAEAGKITGILGSNGCGKSCLLNISFGNLKAKYSLIRINNTPILKPLYQTKLVSYLPQHHFIPNKMMIKTAFKLFKVDWDVFVNTFETLTPYKNFYFKKLSGGERRIIEIYLTLKCPRKIVFLDEPFSHVAPLYIEKIKALIEEEKQKKAIVITDHMYEHIIAVSDTIYLLKNGCTKLIDNVKELEDYKYLSIGTLD
ncbi:ATP-binding cassette domain-containing protein [Flavivirga rizhaonensis]|uniref:ABC transporter ATP-binding protein n=1 Tax=Flavivirga rizhaonensis TaxID=2559571 RepID=A0A4S1DXZ6_9FLAO|nr:ABC transporter ATP-binding protein [Flavivirga rizhaonensis]TGV03050.1 ABC transporter ATP-binding protein [Flavivirga rizhaonensis]